MSLILRRYLEQGKHDYKESKNKQHWESLFPLIGPLHLLLGKVISKNSANSNIIVLSQMSGMLTTPKIHILCRAENYLTSEILSDTILLFELLIVSNFKGPLISLLISFSFGFGVSAGIYINCDCQHLAQWVKSYLKICWRPPVGAGTTERSSRDGRLVPALKHRGS